MSAWVRPTTRWALYLRGDLRCCYCGVTVQEVIADGDSNFLTLDHVRPLKPMKGQPPGDNHPSNLVACCYACNVDKGRLSLRRWCREGGADYRIDGQYWEHLRGQQTLLCPTCNRPEADLEPVPF